MARTLFLKLLLLYPHLRLLVSLVLLKLLLLQHVGGLRLLLLYGSLQRRGLCLQIKLVTSVLDGSAKLPEGNLTDLASEEYLRLQAARG